MIGATTAMDCPLCGGPLSLEPPERFACDHGHGLAGSELEHAAGGRVLMALWMAIEALDSQAQALRVMARSAGEEPALARQAEEDARILRDVVRSHAGS